MTAYLNTVDDIQRRLVTLERDLNDAVDSGRITRLDSINISRKIVGSAQRLKRTECLKLYPNFGKIWTTKEEKLLTRMDCMGICVFMMSFVLGRTIDAIQIRLKTLHRLSNEIEDDDDDSDYCDSDDDDSDYCDSDDDDSEDEEDFEFDVEEIHDHVTVGDETLYWIKWLDYGTEHNSWEPEENLSCNKKLREYFAKSR